MGNTIAANFPDRSWGLSCFVGSLGDFSTGHERIDTVVDATGLLPVRCAELRVIFDGDRDLSCLAEESSKGKWDNRGNP